MAKFQDRLVHLRLEKKMNQSQLAEAMGLSRSAISMYETGRREPDFETLELLADFFNVSIGYILGKTDDPINYDDGDLIANIPLSYVEACDGDIRRAYAMTQAVDTDAQKEKLTVLADDERQKWIEDMLPMVEKLPLEKLELLKQFSKTMLEQEKER